MKTPQEQREELKKHIAEEYTLDDSEVEDGTILVFWKQYESDGFVYPYSAVKGRGLWYITGREGALNWIDFLAFFEQDNHIPNLKEAIMVATEFDLLFIEDE